MDGKRGGGYSNSTAAVERAEDVQNQARSKQGGRKGKSRGAQTGRSLRASTDEYTFWDYIRGKKTVLHRESPAVQPAARRRGAGEKGILCGQCLSGLIRTLGSGGRTQFARWPTSGKKGGHAEAGCRSEKTLEQLSYRFQPNILAPWKRENLQGKTVQRRKGREEGNLRRSSRGSKKLSRAKGNSSSGGLNGERENKEEGWCFPRWDVGQTKREIIGAK